MPIHYPVARKEDQNDDYFGVRVDDPYRWLEDDKSAETAAWVGEENAVTRAYLDPIPARLLVQDRLTRLIDFEKVSAPSRRGERTFYYRNSGLQNQSVLYVKDGEDAPERTLIDPNTLSAEGTAALSNTSITLDGTLMAYSVSYSGSDWLEWRIRDVATSQDLPDLVKWSKFSGASWLPDNSGFFYSRYAEPTAADEFKASNKNQQVHFHKVGTDQSEDTLFYARPDHPEWSIGASVTREGRFLLMYISEGSSGTNRVFYKDLQADGDIVELLPHADARYSVLSLRGTTAWIQTNLDAPRGRLVKVDLETAIAGAVEFTEVIPQAEETLAGIGCVGGRFFAHYSKDACTLIKEYTRDGAFVGDVALPGVGSAGGFSGEEEDSTCFYSYTSYKEPSTIYQYDLATGKSAVYIAPKIDFDPSKFVSKRVFYVSKDGTKVPLFITYKKGLKRNGQNPTYLYGYGGFNISQNPAFSSGLAVWMEMGGIFAVACLRGGGEYGEEWHLAGTKLRKQNVFDDFIAAAEWLIAEGYTSSPKLAIGGGSNGGLLVGACMTQRPELFGAACPAVGVLDMLRYHLFTIGRAWKPDYGCSEIEAEFGALYAYSPLHNVRSGVQYPPTLITTGDHDDRVVPAHSFKFAATLQALQSGENPILIRVETNAGHGAGKPMTKIIAESADKWAFLVKALDIPARKWRRLSR